MTTYGESTTPTPAATATNFGGDHWLELSAAIGAESTEQFGQWLERDLQELTARLDRFVTPRSLQKSQRRG